MTHTGWFSRMFSRSTNKDFDGSSGDEVDSDGNVEELSELGMSTDLRKYLHTWSVVSQPNIMIVSLNNYTFSGLSRRIDYTLSENKSQYWSAITSHLSYWGSMDLCRFVLHQIYSDRDLNNS